MLLLCAHILKQSWLSAESFLTRFNNTACFRLHEEVRQVNDTDYRRKHGTPTVELAPLPSRAQFLNVIESIFSGMARAIVHNSDYQSVDECKHAIDRYFAERNEHFRRYPTRAGGKIWRDERVEPIFSEGNNCKDPRW